MNYWSFVATQQQIDGGIATAKEIVARRIADGFWGLAENAPNGRYLQKGDQVVFYLGSPVKAFAASATLASDFFTLSPEQKKKYWHGKVYEAECGVLLENAQLWDANRPVNDLVAKLKFIENKENWFAYFRGSVRRISADDFRAIVESRGVLAVPTKPIEIIAPRRVSVSLECTKKGAAYQVSKSLHSFLEGRGWTVQKLGKSYATMTPPDGTYAPFVFNIEIPNRDQVMAVAQEMHAIQKEWAGKVGEWTAIYIPPQHWNLQKFNPFTAQAISEPQHGGIIPASFIVGIRLFWNAEVSFKDGEAIYYESESQPILSQPALALPNKIPSSGLADCKLIADIKKIESNKTTDPTIVQALVNARVGQGKFGLQVRQLWDCRCSVTGSCTKAALEASHIQAWADSSDAQRLDPNNGLLLTANLHKLFDAGLISFEDSGKMIVSSKLSTSEQEIFGVIGRRLSKKPSAETVKYLAYHRAKFAE
jgi:hypothetical protein